MKKASILAIAFALAGVTSYAQEAYTMLPPQTMEQEQGKEKVTPDQLPDAVKLAVADDEYKEWTLGEVYKIAPAEDGAPVIYEVQFLNKEEQPVVVRFNEAGKKVDK